VQITEADARRRAETHLDGWRELGCTDIVVDRVEEHSRAWIAYYTTERYRATGSFLDLPVGASPIGTNDAVAGGRTPRIQLMGRVFAQLA
jgi:hypothetical protein